MSSDDAASDSDSEISTRMSLDSFFQSSGTSRTSVDFSMRSPSPAPSVFSMTSSLRAQAYIKEFGRDLNNYSDVYRLPADEEELERLDRQYEMFCKVMGKYSPLLPEVLADDGFQVKTVLDLGCGSGSWIMDVARDFPHCSAVAVDLVPMQSVHMPPNCRSEVDDINLGLEHFYGDFNVVHVGFIASGIRDYHTMIDQISHVLRPGGLIDITETPFYLFGPDKQPLIYPDGTFAPPWIALWLSYAVKAVKARGGDIDATVRIHEWISSHPTFEDVVVRDIWMPASPFLKGDDPGTKFWNEIAATLRDDVKVRLIFQAFMKSGRPLLLGYGLSEEFVDTMQQRAYEELDEAKIPLYAHITNVYARKRH
ncbi:S-adenosyl-L-methionine-dependent methyltransferase [Scleroderma citrinum]